MTVLIVPGLRDAVVGHWQTLLHARLLDAGRPVRSVRPMGRDDLALEPRLAALEREARAIHGPIVVVAHSGCITLAHWARRTKRVVHGALLAAPPEFDRALPEGYPTLDELRAAGWLPVPREPLPFPSIVAASRNDPLARYDGVAELAHAWGSRLVDLGNVGHLNPASGYGPWPRAEAFIRELAPAETERLAR
jgi:predicted alpha/beta hydrolase family esterase